MHLQPGQRLTETQLSEEFGISRTPVREALRKLEQEGWIEKIPNQGYYVRSYTLATLKDIYEVSIALECLAVKLVIEGDRLSDIPELEDKWRGMPRTWEETEGLRMLADDEEFHVRLAEMSENRELHRYISRINDQLRPAKRIDYLRKDWAEGMVADHLTILASIKRKDFNAAQMHLESHIRQGMQTFQSFSSISMI